jgi:colicin import membrane protein
LTQLRNAVEKALDTVLPASTTNAKRTAESYLDMGGFSRKSLIEQLEFEGYSKADSTYAVDELGANWNEQAAIKAASYVDMQGFSRSGLIEQLAFEGFTASQAAYGADSVGL